MCGSEWDLWEKYYALYFMSGKEPSHGRFIRWDPYGIGVGGATEKFPRWVCGERMEYRNMLRCVMLWGPPLKLDVDRGMDAVVAIY